jgi:DNA-binding NarL/FixJ family response regulator
MSRPASILDAMATPPPPATVLIIDDHPLVRQGLASLLTLESWVDQVIEAATGQEAAELVVTERVQIAVVDLGLPDVDGVELVRRLRRLSPQTAVVVLTMSRDDALVRRCLAAGAGGYVLKESPPAVVVRAIHAVLDGGLVLGPRVTTSAAVAPAGGSLPPPLDRLVPRDLRLLRLLAEGRSNKQIALAMGVSEKTVRNRLSGLLATLGVADRVQAALLAREKGLFDSSVS